MSMYSGVSMNLSILAVCVISGLGLWVWSRAKSRHRNVQSIPLPPGPKGLPIIGNVLDMPNESDYAGEWLTFADWGKKYGDIIYVENVGSPMVILNSYQAASDLMEKRSAIYSDRPKFPMVTDIIGWDWAILSQPYGGPTFRKMRQFLHRFFQPVAANGYQDIQTRETHRLLQNLLETPHNFAHHLKRTASAIIMMIVYGHEVAPEGDIFVTIADEAMQGFAQGMRPGAWLVDVIPLLQYVPAWFPGAGWKRKGLEWAKATKSLLTTPFAMTKERIDNGSAMPSMMTQLLDDSQNEGGEAPDEHLIASIAATAYSGGADTTVSTLLSVILAMVLFPEVQERAHEEIDRVIGKNRLPDFNDRDSLPYVEGIVREALRWNPISPLSAPHRAKEDDVYNGYFIPAGCSIIANQWSMLHDEGEYPDPMSFRPERWLQKDGQDGPRHPNKIAFGWGRRICPGRHLADQSVFIGTVNILAMFKIEKKLDTNGQPIIPKAEYSRGLVSYPKPFVCSIKARSPDAVALLHQNTK